MPTDPRPRSEPSLLAELSRRGRRQRLPGGQLLFRRGEPADGLVFLERGRLAVLDEAGVVLTEVGAGSAVGERGALLGEPRSADVRAVRDSEVLVLDQAAVDTLERERPQVLIRWVEELLVRMRSPALRRPQDRLVITVAGLGAAASTVDAAAARLGEVLSRWGSVGTAREADAPEHTRDGWLDELEAATSWLILVAPEATGAWTGLCTRHSDRVVWVAEPDTPRAAPRTSAPGYLLLVQPDAASAPEGTGPWLDEAAVAGHSHARLGVPGDWARLARRLTGRAVGLVLGGGGARALSHLGLLKALEEARIPVDRICGADVGAIVGATYALTGSVEGARAVLRDAALVRRPHRSLVLPLLSLLRGDSIRSWLEDTFGGLHLEDLWLDTSTVASNLTTVRRHEHRRGPLVSTLQASASPVILMPPVVYEGSVFYEGGVTAKVPLGVLQRGREVGTLVASDADPYEPLPPVRRSRLSPLGVLVRRLLPWLREPSDLLLPSLQQRSQWLASATLVREQAGSVDLLVSHPTWTFPRRGMESIDRIVAVGYAAATAALETWDLPEELRGG